MEIHPQKHFRGNSGIVIIGSKLCTERKDPLAKHLHFVGNDTEKLEGMFGAKRTSTEENRMSVENNYFVEKCWGLQPYTNGYCWLLATKALCLCCVLFLAGLFGT